MAEHNLPIADFEALAGELLSQGHSVRFRVRGNSMRPTLQDGDLLEIEPIHAADVRLGDILLFLHPRGQWMVHRVLRLRRVGTLRLGLMQGDAALLADGWIDLQVALGRVAVYERRGRMIRMGQALQRIKALGWAWFSPLAKWVYQRLKPIPKPISD